MAGSSGISTTSLAKGSGSGLSWRGAAPDGNSDVVLQEKPLQRIAVPKVALIKVQPRCADHLEAATKAEAQRFAGC